MSIYKLFIPERLKIGFKENSQCFEKRLAYVIYYDSKGVLRKETSWENWRDKSIEPIEIDNTPRSGFILNKDVKRYNWSYYSSGRSMIRVYDDRGIEFEITPNNLLFILMNTNCFKRELEGEFVYAWDNKELVLLPTCCEEYKTSTQFTKLQGGKITSKEMIPGCVYKTKKDENLVYMGKFPWFSYSEKKNYFREKRYVFISEDSIDEDLSDTYIHSTSDLNHLAIRITDFHIDTYAEKLVELNNNKHCSYPVKLVTEEVTKEHVHSNRYSSAVGIEVSDQVFGMFTINYPSRYNYVTQKWEYEKGDYTLSYRTTLSFSDNKLSRTKDVYSHYYYYSDNYKRVTCKSIEEIAEKFVSVKIELANGIKVNYYDY